jgi:RND family efflux transporter MFP subunit
VVSRVWIAEGNYVSPRAPLVELYDPVSLIVRISIPEQQALAVRAEQRVQIKLDAYPGRHFTGQIVRVYPELERATRTLTAEAVVKEEVRLLSGMFARVDVAVQTLTNAVVVPESALAVMPNGEVVAFVVANETAGRRKVKTTLEAGGAVAVETGIESGEMVVTRGNEMLKDGAKVQVAGQKKKEPSSTPTAPDQPKKEAKP